MAVRSLPEDSDWLYEIKLDGYRCIAARDRNGVTLWSRRANSFTDQFPHIAQACQKLPLDTVVDGEIVALDKQGRTSFNLLQHHRSSAAAIRFYVFDLLTLRGKDLQRLPLSQRRRALEKLIRPIAKRNSIIAISETMHTAPQELIRVVKEFGLEGIVAKRKDSLYESGKRIGSWVKYKINKGQEFVIGGYTQGNPFDAVIVGYYEGGNLIYAAKVRNGFVPYRRRELMSRMKPLSTATCPFVNLPEKKRTQWALTAEEMKKCVWLRPEVVAQIDFTEWTPDGHLRHSTFVGLREDKDPRAVVREL